MTAPPAAPPPRLRPGQLGVATLPPGDAPLGAVLFRRAGAALSRWLL